MILGKEDLKEVVKLQCLLKDSSPFKATMDIKLDEEFSVFVFQMAIVSLSVEYICAIVNVNTQEIMHTYKHAITSVMSMVSQDPDSIYDKMRKDVVDTAKEYLDFHVYADRILLED